MNPYPVHVTARHDAPPNRWLWLVKWILLAPHYLALTVLWIGVLVSTVIAYLAVLLTGYVAVLVARALRAQGGPQRVARARAAGSQPDGAGHIPVVSGQ